MTLESEVAAEITPTPAEESALMRDVDELLAAAARALEAARLPGRPSVQGSVAKGTWLRGGTDIDLFLLLDTGLPEQRLEQAALEVGPKILTNPAKKYAQHPYLMGTFNGRTVDLVPAYAVATAGAKMSAVDRTPFHTAWVRARLDQAGRTETRLLKTWMKGIGVYGAQTAVGGFSGYLVEVLVARFGSFAKVLDWLAAAAKPRRIVVAPLGVVGQRAAPADQVKDDVAPLVVVDPVDPARNCAAAVSVETLDTAVAAAQAYRAAPERRFFFPAPPRAEAAKVLHDSLTRQKALWTGVLLRPKAERMDIVFPQFQRAARTLDAALEHAGFTLLRRDVAVSAAEDEVLLQWISGPALPERRTHRGPADDGKANAQKFREKWQGHADAVGPVHGGKDGRLEVDVRIMARTPAQWLAANLAAQPLGKHVADALPGHRIFNDPAAAPPAWAPRVADTVLGRPPWQR